MQWDLLQSYRLEEGGGGGYGQGNRRRVEDQMHDLFCSNKNIYDAQSTFFHKLFYADSKCSQFFCPSLPFFYQFLAKASISFTW